MKRALSLLLALLVPAIALAVEPEHGAHHAEHAQHAIPWMKLGFSALNLVIFIAILRRFAWPLIRDGLLTRRQQIVTALEQAAQAKRESERLQAEWTERLANLNTELEALRRQAQLDIAAEREQILAAAHKLADSIRRDAQRAAEQEVRNAEALLRKEVAVLALGIARRLAPQRLTADDQQRFVREFIQEVRQ